MLLRFFTTPTTRLPVLADVDVIALVARERGERSAVVRVGGFGSLASDGVFESAHGNLPLLHDVEENPTSNPLLIER